MMATDWTHDTPSGQRDGQTVALMDKIDTVAVATNELITARGDLWRSTHPESRRDT